MISEIDTSSVVDETESAKVTTESTLSMSSLHYFTSTTSHGIFNNSLKYYVLVWYLNPTTTSFIGTFWYNFL